MPETTYRQAVAMGIAQEMARDPSVVLIGEDVGAAGGVFKLTEGLFAEFGPERVRDTPISEQAIVGAAMGAAMTGLRPIAELMFSDFFAVTWDMVANQIAKTRYMTDGQVSIPLVIRTANGAGRTMPREAPPSPAEDVSVTRKPQKKKIVAFKVEEDLAEFLGKLKNKSEFIRQAILAQFSMAWLCWAPKRRPAPFAVWRTSGSETWPSVM